MTEQGLICHKIHRPNPTRKCLFVFLLLALGRFKFNRLDERKKKKDSF